MKIARYRVHQVRPRYTLVRIETDTGLTGWGEATLEGFGPAVAGAVGQDMSPRRPSPPPLRLNTLPALVAAAREAAGPAPSGPTKTAASPSGEHPRLPSPPTGGVTISWRQTVLEVGSKPWQVEWTRGMLQKRCFDGTLTRGARLATATDRAGKLEGSMSCSACRSVKCLANGLHVPTRRSQGSLSWHQPHPPITSNQSPPSGGCILSESEETLPAGKYLPVDGLNQRMSKAFVRLPVFSDTSPPWGR